MATNQPGAGVSRAGRVDGNWWTGPAALRRLLAGYSLHPLTIGLSGATVFQLTRSGQTDAYLKIAPPPLAPLLEAEYERLTWLAGRLPVAPVRYAGADERGNYYLLTGAVGGLMACAPCFNGRVPQVVRLLAAGMHMLHDLSVAGCPFDNTLKVQLTQAGRRLAAGLVDEAEFEQAGEAGSARALYRELAANRPLPEDLVFTHGDYCLPNILISPQADAISGFVDLGRAGIADRYHDIALAGRSLAYNFGEEWVPLLYREYGLDLDAVDQSRIGYYRALDQFF